MHAGETRPLFSPSSVTHLDASSGVVMKRLAAPATWWQCFGPQPLDLALAVVHRAESAALAETFEDARLDLALEAWRVPKCRTPGDEITNATLARRSRAHFDGSIPSHAGTSGCTGRTAGEAEKHRWPLQRQGVVTGRACFTFDGCAASADVPHRRLLRSAAAARDRGR